MPFPCDIIQSATETGDVVLSVGKTANVFQTTESFGGRRLALKRAQRHMSPSLEHVGTRSFSAGLVLCGRGKVQMKLHKSLWSQFDEHAEILRESVDAKIELTLRGLEYCQSPLEQKFLLEFLGFYSTSYDPVFIGDFSHFLIVDDEYMGFTLIKPQAPVSTEGRNFRADFLFTYKTYHPMMEHFRFIVEIDGHDFHERTKEQAKRDRQRDRLMTMEGYTIFRYTGSEIYNNVGAAVVEFQTYFRQLKRAALSSIGFHQ